MSMTDYEFNEILKGEAGERFRGEILKLKKKTVTHFRNNPTRQSLIEAISVLDELEDKLMPQKGLTETDPVE